MPEEKFSPAKQVLKTRKITVELPVYDYHVLAREAKKRKLPIREFIRLAISYAMASLET